MRPKGDAKSLECRRRVAVQLLQLDLSPAEVAEQLDASVRSVHRWRRAAEEEGSDGLAARKHPGRKSRLSEEQLGQLPEILKRGARAAGFATDLWTCERVRQVIRRRFGVDYHPGHVSRLLKEIGGTQQKPQRRPRQRDERAAEQWRERGWPRIKKGSIRSS